MGGLAILSYLGHLRGERRAMRAGAPGAAEDGAA
jgi:hypothetical protein